MSFVKFSYIYFPIWRLKLRVKGLLQVEGIHSKYCMSSPKAIVSTADYQPGIGLPNGESQMIGL